VLLQVNGPSLEMEEIADETLTYPIGERTFGDLPQGRSSRRFRSGLYEQRTSVSENATLLRVLGERRQNVTQGQ